MTTFKPEYIYRGRTITLWLFPKKCCFKKWKKKYNSHEVPSIYLLYSILLFQTEINIVWIWFLVFRLIAMN